MSIQKIKDAISSIDSSGLERPYLSAKFSVAESQIQEAEQSIGFPFPPSYRYFLNEFGSGDFGGFEFYGLVPNKNDIPSIPNALWLTKLDWERIDLPNDLFIVESLDDGCYACLELHENPTIEGRVIFWDMGESEDKPRHELASSFGHYLFDQVSTALQDA